MSRFIQLAHRKFTNLTPEAEPPRELARLVIQATSPEDAPTTKLLNEIANGVTSRKAAETNSAVRALGERLVNSDSRVVLNALSVSHHLLSNVTEPRAALNLRSYMETQLLPKIRRLAKGLPVQPGDAMPAPQVRETALARLQDWAAPRFIGGALSKYPAFAEAYRDASLHTPSPPSSAGTTATSSKPGTASSSSPEDNPSVRPSNIRPQTPEQKSTNGSASGRRESADGGHSRDSDSGSKMGSPPTDDGQFVAYFNKMISLFDKLHRVQHYPLDHDRIKNLRSLMEQNMDRLSRVSENVGTPHQKNGKKAWMFAQQQLKKFGDYRPPHQSSADSSPNSVPAPPPRYPPPLTKRKTGPRVPYGRETSDVHSWNASSSVTTPTSAGSEESAGSNSAAHSHGDGFVEHTPAKASKAQRRMMRAVASACARSPGCSSWSDAYFAVLPSDLSPVVTGTTDARQDAQAVAVAAQGTQTFVRPAAAQSFVGPTSATQTFLAPAPAPRHQYYVYAPLTAQAQLYSAARPPTAPAHTVQHAQVHPQNPTNAYHQFSSYPRAV